MDKAHKRTDSSFSAAGSGYDASADEGHPGDKVAEMSDAARLRALDKIMGNDDTEDSDSGKFILVESSIIQSESEQRLTET